MDAAAADRVRQRAAFRCEYCLVPEELSALRFHVEHIIARQHGGDDEEANLALACPECNWRKGTNLTNLTSLDPDTGLVTTLFHPRLHLWAAHFDVEGTRIMGLSAIGRTTVWLLEWNGPARLHHRAWLVRLRQWPAANPPT